MKVARQSRARMITRVFAVIAGLYLLIVAEN